MLKKFDFITDYKYYGRPKLNEDELDDPLGLTDQPSDNSAEQPADATQGQPAGDTQQQLPVQSGGDSTDNETGDAPSTSDVQEPPAPKDDSEIEVDMTQLVLKQQETATAVQDLLQKIDSLIKTNGNIKTDVAQQLQSFEQKNKETAEKLKQEIQMRTPTPLEKLELRSMSSFPYNIKLSDYWTPAEGDKYKYSIANAKPEMNNNQTNVEKTPQEFVLKQSEIMRGYDENYVKNSF